MGAHYADLVEEVLYRGIILSLLKGKSMNFAIVGSALMFGLSHLITAAGGKSLMAVIFQVAMAVIIGVILAIIMINTKSLYN